MGRKGRIFGGILNVPVLAGSFLTAACMPQEEYIGHEERTVRVNVQLETQETTLKSTAEHAITDVSLIVFNDDGLAERYIAYDRSDSAAEIDLILGRRYSFYAFTGFGYRITADHISEMDELTYHITEPKEADASNVMCGYRKDVTISENPAIVIPLKRMAARISVGMDRSHLAENVEMEVTSIRIGNCPKQAKAFGESRVMRQEDCFGTGYSVMGRDVSVLNIEDRSGRSGRTELFMLENMQGDISDMYLQSDKDKVFDDDDPRSRICSYIEVQMNYLSQRHFNNGGPLIYRFYLGDGLSNLDVERNCHYSITICPEDDGLSENSWRVDKTNIHEFGPAGFASFPESYIQGNIGDTLHLYCEFYPPHTPFEIDMEELEYDRGNGVYDYIIDEDGHGVRLILTGPGTGIVYMEAGEPVNEAAMWVVEVNMPSKTLETATDSSQYMSPCMTSTAQESPQRPGVRLHHLPQDRDRSPSQPRG